MLPIKQTIKRRFTIMLPQITCVSALPDKTGKHENFIFFHSNAVLVHCLNSASFISSIFDSRLILSLLHDSLHLVINAFSSGAVGGMVRDKRSRERSRSWTAFHAQCTSALSYGFPISQGNAETLDRWGGKTEHRLISYVLGNTSAQNYRNRTVYFKIIASQRWDEYIVLFID